MPLTKSFKIHIENIVAINVDGLDFSAIRVEIKNNKGNVIKTIPLNQLTQMIINLEAQDRILMIFTLLQFNNMGGRQFRPFAQGSIKVQTAQFQKEHNFAVGCSIKNIINKKTVISLVVIIKEDLQKMFYEIPDSQRSQSQIQPQNQPQKQKTIIQIIPTPRQKTPSPQPQPDPPKNKLSPIKRNTKRPIRNRHSQYVLKNESSKLQIVNKVVDENSLLFEDMKIQLDQPISSLQFYGQTYQEMLAQVHFHSNPTQLQLKNLKIKIPQNQKSIDIHLKTLEGAKLMATTNLRSLQQNQCVKISCNFKDQKNAIKGKMKFNFKENSNDEQNNYQKMQMAQEVSIFDRKKLADQIQSISYLFPQSKQKIYQQQQQQQTPRLKLPNINRRQPKFSFQAFNETIVPQPKSQPSQNFTDVSSKLQVQPVSNRQKFSDAEYNYLHSSWQDKRDNQTKIRRSRTIHQRTYDNQQIQQKRIITTILPTQIKKSIINITGVSIKFYKSYLQSKHNKIEKQTFTGKFLQIYTNQKKIYRSEPAYAATTLNWKLEGCSIQISQYDNLTFQLNAEKHKSLVGELIISYNQLKFNQEQNSLYFGYLTSNYQVIAKICIQFMLSTSTQLKSEGRTLQNTQRKTRMKRLYSQDIAYVGNQQQIKRQNHSKTSLRQSIAIPFPEGIRKQKLYEQQKQLQTISQKKKRKLKSPLRRQKYF